MFTAAFLGIGGSCAYNGGQRTRRGTNTPCVAVRAGADTLIFDAGSGIVAAKKHAALQNTRYHMFISHYHIDHLEGLLFWNALFDPEKSVCVYGSPSNLGSARDTVGMFLSAPFHPAGINDFRADVTFRDIAAGETVTTGGGAAVKTAALNHPGGCLGYRVDYCGKSVCYISDIELNNHRGDSGIAEFAKDADLLICDASYENGKCVPGWGHSSPSECAALAKSAGVKKLALFHYGHHLTDDDIDRLEASAKNDFSGAFAPYDGLCVEI